MALQSCKKFIFQICRHNLRYAVKRPLQPVWLSRRCGAVNSLYSISHRTLSSQIPTVEVAQQETPATNSAESGVVVPENTEVIDPLQHEDFFGVRDLFTVHDLYDARVHLGHKIGLRHDYMKPYIFGNRLGVDIIDLDQTSELLCEALNFTAHIAYLQGVILFLTRHQRTLLLVEQTAKDCGEYAHCRYWKGGTFTNATVQYGALTRLPDLCIFIGTNNTIFEPNPAQIETAKMNVPAVGIVDTSCDPRLITYPVPGNDDSTCAIELYCKLFKQAILMGKAKRTEMMTS